MRVFQNYQASLRAVFLGVCLFVVTVTGALGFSLTGHWPSFFFKTDDGSLLQTAWPTLEEAAGALLFAIVLGGSLLALAGSYAALRKPIKILTGFLADIPALGALGLLLAIGPSYLAICLVGGFSLGVRCVTIALEASQNVPSPLMKTAASLRLTTWQTFLHVKLPALLPLLARTAARDMPDFWVRLLGAQSLVFLCTGTMAAGWGARAIGVLSMGKVFPFIETVLACVFLIFIIHQSIFRPLLKYVSRYEIVLSDAYYKNQEKWAENNKSLFRIFFVVSCLGIGAFINVIDDSYKSSLVIGILILFIQIAVALALAGLVWLGIGGLVLGASPKSRWKLKNASVLCGLFPLYLLYLPLHTVAPVIFTLPCLLAITIQGLIGATILFRPCEQARLKLFHQANILRLPWLSEWRAVRLPLVMPGLARGLLSSSWLVWNSAILGVVLLAPHSTWPFAARNEGAIREVLLGSSVLSQLTFLLYVTAAAYGNRVFLLLPWQEYVCRKYRLHS